MQTRLPADLLATPRGREAEAILRACVHCGFCNATCPTYQLLGDELDGPRGRIYLIKQMLEGQPVTAHTRQHLDRCLTCRNCETTCPSGVQYGRLLELGREEAERRAPRPLGAQLLRQALRRTLTRPALFAAALRLGRTARGLLPQPLRQHLPAPQRARRWPTATHPRRMLLLQGCVQPALTPATNAASARVLDRLGIAALPADGCCGAIDLHLAAPEAALAAMRRNIDAWWPQLEAGVEAIVSTASGCGSVVKDYGHHLRHDPAYAAKAARVAALTRDLAEVLAAQDLGRLRPGPPRRVAFHAPCSLQHGQRVRGVVEDILTRAGHQLLPFAEPHLCCGSAGTYALLQPEFASALRARKLTHLLAAAPQVIATANIGCQTHLAAAARVPVVHWITLLDNPAR